jgi:flagellar biosynthesis protein FlhB
MLNEENINLTCHNKTIIKIGLIITISSIVLGVMTNFSRIIDFRLTLKKIKKELGKESDFSKLKSAKKVFGNITWFLFYLQILTLFIGIIMLSIGLFDLYNDKL